MQITAFASLITLALALVVACLLIGNTWIGLALLFTLGVFAYNHLNVPRAKLKFQRWLVRQQLRMIDNAICEAQVNRCQAQFDLDHVRANDELTFILALDKQRSKLVTRIRLLDFELEH